MCLVQDGKVDPQWKHRGKSCQAVATGPLLTAGAEFP